MLRLCLLSFFHSVFFQTLDLLLHIKMTQRRRCGIAVIALEPKGAGFDSNQKYYLYSSEQT